MKVAGLEGVSKESHKLSERRKIGFKSGQLAVHLIKKENGRREKDKQMYMGWRNFFFVGLLAHFFVQL